MADQPTCGQGLAAQAVVPATLADVVDAEAEVLEVHMRALDRADPDAKAEYEAYDALAVRHREAANHLRTLASSMRAHRDLPMGRHDMAAMTGPAPLDAFEGFVRAKQELQTLLGESAEPDRQMLAAMRAAQHPR
jgi:hypothetical protein